ncbi:FixG Ig-like domain-containing protein [Thalassolituus maritimus]|uniref:FixG Ig-like domain-containing protein n=1 Tax=Thalassolituus maritimus TaxID=484498 RepID=UPI00333E317F
MERSGAGRSSGGYLVVFAIAVFALADFIVQRPELSVTITRDRQSLYQVMPDNRVCNFYDLEIDTFAGYDTQVSVAVTGISDITLTGSNQFTAKEIGTTKRRYQLCVNTPQPRKTAIEFVVRSDADEVRKATSFFYGQ